MKRSTFVVFLALLAACARPEKPQSIETESNRVEARVSVRVTGTDAYELDTTTTILIYRTLDKRIPEGLRLFSVGIPDPGVKLADGFFRTAFDVLGFKGDGQYTIGPTILDKTPQGPSGIRLPSGIQSNAFVQWFRPAASSPVVRYDVALKACDVRSADSGRSGRLECPSLRRDTGTGMVSLVLTWAAK